MVKKFVSAFNLLIPFFESYPLWVKALLAIWLLLTAVMVISLLFSRSPKNKTTNEDVINERTKYFAKAETVTSPKAVLEIKVDFKKNLILENKGSIDLKDISIFATRYVFDDNSFGKENKIKEYNKMGGVLYNISRLEAKVGKESFDLKKHPFIEIYDKPFVKGNYMPSITFYCLRVVYREASTGEKHIDHYVTTSYTDFPSPIENQEMIASCGTPEGDFMYKIPKVIKDHQKTIFGE